MKGEIKVNHNINDLWCVESKERINIGEKYVEIFDGYLKTYKLAYVPVDSEDDDLYIGENYD